MAAGRDGEDKERWMKAVERQGDASPARSSAHGSVGIMLGSWTSRAPRR